MKIHFFSINIIIGKNCEEAKIFSALVGLLTYLDWTMVLITALSCGSMLCESPWPTTGENMIFNNPYLQAIFLRKCLVIYFLLL